MRIVFASQGFVSGQVVNFRVYNHLQVLIADIVGQEWGSTGNYFIDISLVPTELYLIIAEEAGGIWKASRFIRGGVDIGDCEDVVGPPGPPGPQGIQGVPGVGVPSGGLAGQVLSKITDSDYETTWQTVDVKRKLNAEVFFNGTLTNGSWFRRSPGTGISGSWSGYPSAYPFVLPFDCTLSKIFLNVSGAGYDWRGSPGEIFIDIGIFSHVYNGSSKIYTAGLTLDGPFSGSSFSGQNIKEVIVNMTDTFGTNAFLKNTLVGFMLLKEASRSGQCNNLVNSYLSFEFTEV